MLKHMPNDELKHLAKHYFLVNKSFCLYHKTEHRVIVEFQLKKMREFYQIEQQIFTGRLEMKICIRSSNVFS